MKNFHYKVMVNPYMPDVNRISLSASCPCSDSVRSSMNEWLKLRFGTVPQFLLFCDTVITNRRGYDMMQKACDNHPTDTCSRVYSAESGVSHLWNPWW